MFDHQPASENLTQFFKSKFSAIFILAVM